ncbi:hypothetical protein ACNI3K_00630 [Demequina sp. SO4-13]|uniref:hypothetical protein n=1 Tax=Demequina sp. SO4-13 TaxID=3401027 RepID=UPI003AF80885
MADKRYKKRKFAALALALVGVAGLSVASAATLTVEASNEVAIGSGEFTSCDTAVDVDYTYDEDTFLIKNVNVTDIAELCNGKDVRVVLMDSADAELADISGTVASGAFSEDLSALDTPITIPIGTNLGDVTVIIG